MLSVLYLYGCTFLRLDKKRKDVSRIVVDTYTGVNESIKIIIVNQDKTWISSSRSGEQSKQVTT